MKRRYMTLERDDRHSAEVDLFDLIPESAIDEANAWLDINHIELKQREVKDREYIVRAHDRFEICVETSFDRRYYEFAYNPLIGEVKYVTWGGDFI